LPFWPLALGEQDEISLVKKRVDIIGQPIKIYSMANETRFGHRIRSLRKNKGESIKSLAKELEVNYTYLSQIENNKKVPSEEFIEKIAQLFNHDPEELKVLAGKIPGDVKRILMENPREAIDYLRRKFNGNIK